MERCPVCRARLKDDPVCYRCGTDLAIPLSIETQVAALEQQAVILLGKNDLLGARRAAKQVLQLKHSALALAVLGFIKQALLETLLEALVEVLVDEQTPALERLMQ